MEGANLKQLLAGPEQLPDPLKIDDTHREWRKAVIGTAKIQGLDFTHGVAAKLINIYLKAGFVCGGHDTDPRVQADPARWRVGERRNTLRTARLKAR